MLAREYRMRTKYHLKRDKKECARFVREWNERNRDKVREYQKQWKLKNPDRGLSCGKMAA